MTREELNTKTAKELRSIASEMNIPGRWDMTKDQLIEAIVSKDSKSAEVETVVESAKTEETVEVKVNVEETAVEETATNVESTEEVAAENSEKKMQYLRKIERGMIVAFRVNIKGVEKVKSAAVENVSQKREMLKLVTKYGAEFIVPFKDVVWVRTNARWPKGVYELLKGVKKDGE